jgi:hypothetical protein
MKKNSRIMSVGSVVFILMIIITFLHAQAPDTLWTRTYGGYSGDLGRFQQTSDGGYIIVASTWSFGSGPMVHEKRVVEPVGFS